MDFKLKTIHMLLASLQNSRFKISSVSDSLKEGYLSPYNQIILRHDVDLITQKSLMVARIEHELGIRGTYYFRIGNKNFEEALIREITGLGHEIGYHYETLAQIREQTTKLLKRIEKRLLNIEIFRTSVKEQDLDLAYQLFTKNLSKLREIVPVETICMHGSPLFDFDNREIWKKYDYRELGIIGEASMDVDFSKVAYYTDTGRRWDGADFSVRDKVNLRLKDLENEGLSDKETERGIDHKTKGSVFPKYHSTFDMIKAIEDRTFPDQAMITIHPQRWNDALIQWTKELVWQNVKNVGKWFIIKMREHK